MQNDSKLLLPLLVMLALPACLDTVDGSAPEDSPDSDPTAGRGTQNQSGRGGSSSKGGSTSSGGTTSSGAGTSATAGTKGVGDGTETGGANSSGGASSSGGSGGSGGLGGSGGSGGSAGSKASGGSTGSGGSAGKGGTSGTGGTSGSGGAGGTGTTNPDDSVPSSAYCTPVSDWQQAWTDWENEVLELVNQRRAEGATCGGVPYKAVAPLAKNPMLRCAARVHSVDMVERNFFDHTNPGGETPSDRIKKAGYKGSGSGENIAAGQRSPAAVMDTWMKSSGHCTNIMRGSYKYIGVGYYPGNSDSQYGHYWTQNFGG
jgi:uncharacterized protein YkwD